MLFFGRPRLCPTHLYNELSTTLVRRVLGRLTSFGEPLTISSSVGQQCRDEVLLR